MPIVVYEIFLGVVAVATGGLAYHNYVSKSNNASSYSQEKSNTIKDKLTSQLILWVMKGIVTIEAKIEGNEKAKQENYERMRELESAAATGAAGVGMGAIGTAISMNFAQDAIQTITDGANDITAIPDVGSPIPNPLIPPDVGLPNPPPFIPPAIPDEGPIPSPLNPPDVGQMGSPPLDPPDGGPFGIPPFIRPVEKPKGLGDNISYAKKKTKENTNSNDSNESGDKEKMLGENGTQVASETTWQNGKTERIDVENPSPGKRPGQIHYHEPNNTKWYFDIIKKVFYDPKTGQLAPKRIQKLLNNDDFIKGINKALKLLGENKLK